ncbi:MAG: type VI secretion system amidase effector protein Tae4 [Candidatus Thiosymbion ectosymbiont of Robbea hypermnestra]|nr:type VI secretion system amidase effector protein Tae4 [Candidatus Thiosymbion ectosymbiont of Robbea hypermnestra]
MLKDKKGMIFIMNGWGNSDHIDVWKGNGVTGTLKDGFESYFGAGMQVWFWAFD